MKTFRLIKNIAFTLAMGCVASCNYLDIVPPEQAALPDATKDAEATLGFLFSCYAGVNGNSPYNYSTVEAGADEWVLPPLWNEGAQKITWDTNTAASLSDGWRWGNSIYRYVGQCHLFLQEIENARGVTDEQKKQWSAEVQFLLAYYHMQALIMYGPCPINDRYIDQTTPESEFPGRSHFDYVTEWICNKFDEACNSGYLPATRTGDEWGRATSVMAKALKARLLVYAASPLWNGGFPDKEWKNKNYETPGYGLELVSHEYDKGKWEKALNACIEAEQAAREAGHKLFELADSKSLREKSEIPLPYVPFKDENQAGQAGQKDADFKERVMLMRYVVATRYDEGNRETIWGLANQGTILIGSMPHRVIKNNQGIWRSGYSGVSPTLNAIERFYTENGEPIRKDELFYPESEWFQAAGAGEGRRADIIKLNTRREPRFYAWIAFDGGDMGSRINGGNPLTIDLKNGEMNGYNPSLFNRDNNVTGYFNQKFFEPTYAWHASSDATQSKPRPLIRMAEMYLNLAECYAALDQKQQVIENLNKVRSRAGIRDLEMSDFDKMSPMDWVRNERTVELWAEGHRYYDIRRWMIAKENMGAGVRKGLNAMVLNPSFETFNTPVVIDQPFKWTDRMYLLPLFANEVYKNPQFVQAPGY